MFDKVFISYAKEDIQTAEQLFNFLTNSRYSPWLDKKKLLPGQDWNTEIKLALKKADFIILLLSHVSIAKRGYFQREFKLALEYCEEKLDTDIYIIPCKIDDCEVPDKLAKYQWVELSKSDSFNLIINSLNTQRKKYVDIERIKIQSKVSYELTEVKIKKEIDGKPKSFIDIVYPKFIDVGNEDLRLLNTYIEYPVLKSYNGFLEPFGDGLFNEPSYEHATSDFALDISYKIELVNKHFISYTIFSYTYTGGAHGIYGTKGYNYRLNPLLEFNLPVLLDNDPDTLETLRFLCKEKLLKRAKEEFEIDNEKDFFLSEDHLKSEWDTFDNFYLKTDSIIIIFPIYQETAYALGQHEVEIRYEEILDRHQNLKSITRLMNIMRA